MKRFTWIPLILAAFVLMACSLTSALGGNANPPQEDAQGAPSQLGADVLSNQPNDASPETTTSDAAPAEAAADSSFHDDFNETAADWGDTLTVTTQAIGGKSGSTVTTDAGKLTFQFQAKETYAYKFLQTSFPADVVVETKFLALNHINNGVAIVCRANDDMSEWLEVQLTSRSKYSIFHYDKARKDNEGKNPYVQLATGGVNVQTMYPMKDNVVKVTCSGSKISLEINGAQVTSFDGTPILSGGKVGLGAMSTDVLPIGVQFDYLDVSQP